MDFEITKYQIDIDPVHSMVSVAIPYNSSTELESIIKLKKNPEFQYQLDEYIKKQMKANQINGDIRYSHQESAMKSGNLTIFYEIIRPKHRRSRFPFFPSMLP